jgi:hypothetical protein
MTVVDSRAVRRLVERHPLGTALILSLVIHVGVYSGWQTGKHLGWWNHHPAWLTTFTRWLAKPNVAKARPNRTPENQVIAMRSARKREVLQLEEFQGGQSRSEGTTVGEGGRQAGSNRAPDG